MTDPTIILADEPTGDLDKESAGLVMGLLQQLNRELGKTLVMVTHDPRTTAYANQTLHLEKGRLVERQGVDGSDASVPVAAPLSSFVEQE